MKVLLCWYVCYMLLWHRVGGNKAVFNDSQESSLVNLIGHFCPKLTALTCSANNTKIEESRCCAGCSCDPVCGLYSNCCYDDDDLYKLTEKGIVECLYPGTRPHSSRKAMPMYKFVVGPPSSGCYNAAGSCNFNPKNLIPWTNFNPVFSTSKRINFVTEDCAKCHGVFDFLPWGSMLTFSSVTPQNVGDLLNTILEGGAKYIYVAFIPPVNDKDLLLGLCSKYLTNSCPNSSHSEAHVIAIRQRLISLFPGSRATYEDVKTGCLHGPNIPFLFRKGLYKNVFCAICNSIPPESRTCSTPLIRTDQGTFTAVMDFKFIRQIVDNNRGSKTVENVPMACKKGSLHDTSCPPVLCPAYQMRSSDGTCVFPMTHWYLRNLMVNLNLTAVSSRDLDIAFANVTDVALLDMFYKHMPWHKSWRMNLIGMKTYKMMNRHRIEIVMQMKSDVYESIPHKLMNSIQNALSKPWLILTGSGILSLRQEFLRYTIVHGKRDATGEAVWWMLQSGSNYLQKTAGLNSSVTDTFSELYNTSIRWDLLFKGRKEMKPHTHINKMFFCPQVQLTADEFVLDSQNDIIRLISPPKFLFAHEIVPAMQHTPIKVQVCVEDAEMIVVTNRSPASRVPLNMDTFEILAIFLVGIGTFTFLQAIPCI